MRAFLLTVIASGKTGVRNFKEINMVKWTFAAAAVALAASISAPSVQADSISSVENARAKERAGMRTNREDRALLRKYGRSGESYGYDGYGYGYGGGGGYYDGGYGGVNVYIGPRRPHHYDYPF